MNVRNIKLVLEYDGSSFYGFQRQPDHPTIQAALEEALSRFFNRKIKITAASGRTDTGVHAAGQVANFKIKTGRSLAQIQKGINALLPRSVAVVSIHDAGKDFHARYNARMKAYEYRVWNHPIRSPLLAGKAFHVPELLNLAAMRRGAQCLQGRHDFRSFCVTSSARENTVRILKRFEIKKDKGFLRFQLEANGFLHHMVRNLVGTLLDMGRGKLDVNGLEKILAAKDRRRAGATVPAHGLILLNVTY